MDETMQEILEKIDDVTGEDEMGLSEAVEFLEELVGELAIRLDAMKNDLNKKGG